MAKKKKVENNIKDAIEVPVQPKSVSSTRITFANIYTDFRRRHPRLAKQVIHWVPHDTLQIRVYLEDGMIIIYDYWNHRGVISHANWRRDHLHLGGWNSHDL